MGFQFQTTIFVKFKNADVPQLILTLDLPNIDVSILITQPETVLGARCDLLLSGGGFVGHCLPLGRRGYVFAYEG